MEAILIALFFIGYLLIVFEHSIKLDKTVPALMLAVLLWSLLSIGFHNGWYSIIDAEQHIYSYALDSEAGKEAFTKALQHHLAKTAEIIVFLICAMTIVEFIDIHRGFSVVYRFVNTQHRRSLLWIIGLLAFFLSASIDNLTTTIIIVTLLRHLVRDTIKRWWYIGMAIIAANAGGAWSPIGDVTSTMLWISEKVSALGLVYYLILPSLVCFVIPFAIASFLPVFSGLRDAEGHEDSMLPEVLTSRAMLILGIAAIVFVPIFKALTHLPPYVGIMFGLAVVWLFSEYTDPEDHISVERRAIYSAKRALRHIEMSSILFFLGILMSVGALETLVFGSIDGSQLGTMRYFAESLQTSIPNQDIVVMLLGVFSAIIDNVPLVAASIAMYTEALDDKLWQFIAYAAGTGGSMLIIGSASGVTAMGMENMSFTWYFKHISWLAVIGFVGGAITFLLLFPFL